MDEHDHEGQQQNSAQQSSRSPAEVEEREAAEGSAESQQTKSGIDRAVKPRWTPYKRATIILQALTLFALVAYTIVNYNMLQSMRATNQLGLANLKRIEDSNTTAREGIAENKRQAEASRTQSAKDAAASLELARKSLEESQRAWLDVSAIMQKLPRHGEKFLIALTNTGHTPARNVSVNIGPGIGDGANPWGGVGFPYPRKTPKDASVTTIGVGVPAYVPLEGFELTDEQIASINQGKTRIYLFGYVLYNDVFSTHARHSRFCSFFQPATTSWVACRLGNDAD